MKANLCISKEYGMKPFTNNNKMPDRFEHKYNQRYLQNT